MTLQLLHTEFIYEENLIFFYQCTVLFLRILGNLSRSYLVKHEDAGCGTSSEGTLDEEESREDVCLYDSEHSNGDHLH